MTGVLSAMSLTGRQMLFRYFCEGSAVLLQSYGYGFAVLFQYRSEGLAILFQSYGLADLWLADEQTEN